MSLLPQQRGPRAGTHSTYVADLVIWAQQKYQSRVTLWDGPCPLWSPCCMTKRAGCQDHTAVCWKATAFLAHGADGLTNSCIQPAPEDPSGFPPTECEDRFRVTKPGCAPSLFQRLLLSWGRHPSQRRSATLIPISDTVVHSRGTAPIL